jgi:cation diffusion facilitator family transporter
MRTHKRNSSQMGIRQAVVSVLVNTALFGVKFWAGMVSGSVALIADAWHTFSDSITSVVVIIGIKLSGKKPTASHPFGYGRWELITALICGIILAIVAYEFTTDAIARLKTQTTANFGMIAILVTAGSIVIKEILAQYAFWVYRKTGLLTMKAEGWHHRSDSLSSVIVLIGILVAKFVTQFWWMDSILGVFCSLAIFYAAFQIMRESITKLLGEEPSQELIDKINSEVKKIYNEDFNIHHFHLHNYISQKELTLHIRLDKNMTIEDGHKIATVIENMIKEQFGMAATIHIEPLR